MRPCRRERRPARLPADARATAERFPLAPLTPKRRPDRRSELRSLEQVLESQQTRPQTVRIHASPPA
jgi:hypothetical protein